MYVVAECGGNDVGVMHANRESAGEWETFYVLPQPNGQVSIRSSHGRYLGAEGGGGSEYHANRHAVGPWELFYLDGNLTDGSEITLKTHDNQHFVSARISSEPIGADDFVLNIPQNEDSRTLYDVIEVV